MEEVLVLKAISAFILQGGVVLVHIPRCLCNYGNISNCISSRAQKTVPKTEYCALASLWVKID